MEFVPGLVGAAAGLLVGWTFHVLIRRTPMRQPLTRPGFHCGNCGVATVGIQRVATLAWLVRDKRCRTCAAALWPGVPGIEIGGAAVLGFAAAHLGFAWALPAYLVFFAALYVITIVDLRHYLIPNWIVYPALFSCLGLLVLASVATWDVTKLLGALAGMAITWVFFFIVWAAYPKGMGFGDVRLSALIGLLAGWIHVQVAVLAIILGLLFGAASGLLLMVVRLRTRRQFIPFGPFLALGAAVAILYSEPIFDWWLRSG